MCGQVRARWPTRRSQSDLRHRRSLQIRASFHIQGSSPNTHTQRHAAPQGKAHGLEVSSLVNLSKPAPSQPQPPHLGNGSRHDLWLAWGPQWWHPAAPAPEEGHTSEGRGETGEGMRLGLRKTGAGIPAHSLPSRWSGPSEPLFPSPEAAMGVTDSVCRVPPQPHSPRGS